MMALPRCEKADNMGYLTVAYLRRSGFCSLPVIVVNHIRLYDEYKS